MRDALEEERKRREAYEERRRKSLSPQERLAEDLWVQLFGDRRNPQDTGEVGRIREELRQLRRRQNGLITAVTGAWLTLTIDLLYRVIAGPGRP